MGGIHRAVLLEEAVGAPMAGESGLGGEVYVDGTFGRGGHSAAILSALSGGQRLVAFDKDYVDVVVYQHPLNRLPRRQRRTKSLALRYIFQRHFLRFNRHANTACRIRYALAR